MKTQVFTFDDVSRSFVSGTGTDSPRSVQITRGRLSTSAASHAPEPMSSSPEVIQLDEVLAPSVSPPVKVNYTDLDLSGTSLNPSPVVTRPPHTPATDYAMIDFEATAAAAQAGRDHVRLRENLTRTASIATGNTQQP